MTIIAEPTDADTDVEAPDTQNSPTDGKSVDTARPAKPATDLSASAEDTSSATPPEPLFTVVKGSPSDEELAALVVVFSAIGSRSEEPGSQLPPETWGAPTHMHRVAIPFSPYSFPLASAFRH